MSTKNLSHPYLIYGWWIMSFELVSALYALYVPLCGSRELCTHLTPGCRTSRYVILKAPKKAVGAVGLLAVLTASTFLFLHVRPQC